LSAHREVLRIAAVLGREFCADALCDVVPAAGSMAMESDPATNSAVAALEAAERLNLLYREPGDGWYRFSLDLVRELLCEEVSAADRARLQQQHMETAAAVDRAEPSEFSPAHKEANNVFRREGEYWTMAYGGLTCRVRDTKGLTYVAFLLQRPGELFHVSEIVRVAGPADEATGRPITSAERSLNKRAGLGDAGTVLDAQARAEYRQRLTDLQDELEEAKTNCDIGRTERLEREIDFLTQELAGAVGLGGRDRRVGSHTERARVNVTRSIARTVEKIAEHHQPLADHFARTIKTGTFCTYAPDSRDVIKWEL